MRLCSAQNHSPMVKTPMPPPGDEMLFVAKVLHEVRSSAQLIITHVARILAQRNYVAEHLQPHLLRLDAGSARLCEQVEQIVDYVHARRGPVSQLQVFNVQEVLLEVLSLIEGYSSADDLNVTVSAHDALVRMDLRAFRVVARNLLDNAIKYTEHGSVIAEAHVIDSAQGRALKLVVTDTGRGISQDLLQNDRVYEVFVRGEGHGEIGGMGIGLSTVRSTVLALGGSIDLVSAVGSGTRVVVLLPIAEGQHTSP